MSNTAIEAAGLGKRFGRRGSWALRECSFRLPAGRVCAVVGPNGAGKSTLLSHTAGLLAPTEGALTVLGAHPAAARERVAYVAQDKPLYPQLTVDQTLRLGQELNPARWDARVAGRIAYEVGGLDPKKRIRALSGGQRTRVALALALGKRPELLLLDEPMADLDPLGRHELMGTLMAEAAEYGTTVVMSSHVVAELEGSCDYLLLIGDGRVRLAGDLDDLLAAHTLTTGAVRDLAPHTVVESRTTGRQQTALIRPRGPYPADAGATTPSLEELVLAHLRNPAAPALILTPARAQESAA
ncbi:ABC transporter ATP-binding protein [Streptomyces fagopyri]|uniref:ABC transporter ATP-binding protein n=1 Tax=Streptomyces fagopyri TaxID=2662397 RepID=UPI00368934C3